MTKIIKESFRNFFENFCRLSRNQILQISITRKKTFKFVEKIVSDTQLHTPRSNFVFELVGGLIFATTRLSVCGSSCVDTARIFLVADFNNRLPLEPRQGARKKDMESRVRRVPRTRGGRRLSHCLYVTTSPHRYNRPLSASSSFSKFNPSTFSPMSCSFVTFDPDIRKSISSFEQIKLDWKHPFILSFL